MLGDTLSDLLRAVRLRGALYYYIEGADPWVAEAPAARVVWSALLGLRLWPAVRCAQGHGLRCRFGPKARDVFPQSAPLRVAGENFTPDFALHDPFTGANLVIRRQRRTGGKQ